MAGVGLAARGVRGAAPRSLLRNSSSIQTGLVIYGRQWQVGWRAAWTASLDDSEPKPAFTVFERAFKDFGFPKAIRTDNGAPFASASAIFGLSKLSVWWLRLGI